MTSYFMMNRGFSFGIGDVTTSKKLLAEKQVLLEKGYEKCNGYKMPQQSSIVDANYIELLISAGLYVDGKLNLNQLASILLFSLDQYYAPALVTETSWKYESLLTNTYAHYDGDDVI